MVITKLPEPMTSEELIPLPGTIISGFFDNKNESVEYQTKFIKR